MDNPQPQHLIGHSQAKQTCMLEHSKSEKAPNALFTSPFT